MATPQSPCATSSTARSCRSNRTTNPPLFGRRTVVMMFLSIVLASAMAAASPSPSPGHMMSGNHMGGHMMTHSKMTHSKMTKDKMGGHMMGSPKPSPSTQP